MNLYMPYSKGGAFYQSGLLNAQDSAYPTLSWAWCESYRHWACLLLISREKNPAASLVIVSDKQGMYGAFSRSFQVYGIIRHMTVFQSSIIDVFPLLSPDNYRKIHYIISSTGGGMHE